MRSAPWAHARADRQEASLSPGLRTRGVHAVEAAWADRRTWRVDQLIARPIRFHRTSRMAGNGRKESLLYE